MTKLTTQDKQSKELTDKPEFEPTPHMEKWLDVAIQLGTDNITEIETESKITAQSWYNWQKQEGFLEWYNAEWDRRISGWGWKLDAIGMKNAKRDFNYWKSMQNRTGRLNDPKGPNVQVNNFMPILGEKKAE